MFLSFLYGHECEANTTTCLIVIHHSKPAVNTLTHKDRAPHSRRFGAKTRFMQQLERCVDVTIKFVRRRNVFKDCFLVENSSCDVGVIDSGQRCTRGLENSRQKVVCLRRWFT